jgi:oxygen-independent coproporphyrinogen-3 oxidase
MFSGQGEIMSDAPARAARTGPLALYVHIPFCETKCPYCDFNTYAGIESLIPSYVAALNNEISVWSDLLGGPAVDTVFFGGGTPSYLPAERIASIIGAIRGGFDVASDVEVTLESNPGDFKESKLTAYLEAGVNRLSIGVQSLDDRLLEMLGRRHSADQAVEAYTLALDAGFDNVNVDLMYGLPHQTLAEWQATLDGVAELRPAHISMYCLTLEEGTVMEQQVRSGQVPDPDPDLAADMYVMAQESMAPLGYRHYEISNWAQPDCECRHNLAYWRNLSYLGVGPGAHSYLDSFRFWNLKSPREYVRLLQEGSTSIMSVDTLSAEVLGDVPVVESVEDIDARLEMAETLMMGLRLDTGITVDDFARRFGVTPSQAYGETIEELSSIGLLEGVNGRLRLTPRGRLFGNEVFSRFFAD